MLSGFSSLLIYPSESDYDEEDYDKTESASLFANFLWSLVINENIEIRLSR